MDAEGLHEEALAGADRLADENKLVPLVHSLRGILYQNAAARQDEGVLAETFREMACSAYHEAVRMAPNCIVTAVAHAEALFQCRRYSEAYEELSRTREYQSHIVDPAAQYVGYEQDRRKLENFIDAELVSSQVKQVLKLDRTQTAQAQRIAKSLAEKWPFSVRAQLLHAHMSVEHALSDNNVQGGNKATFLRHALSIVNTPRAADNSLVLGLFKARILFELDCPTAPIKCCEAISASAPDDPINQDVPPRSVSGKDYSARVGSIKSMLRDLYDRIIYETTEFWESYQMKDQFLTVRVDTLCQHYAGVQSCRASGHASRTILDACSFVKEHKQWGFWICEYEQIVGLDSFLRHLRSKHGFQVFEKLEALLGPEMQVAGNNPDWSHSGIDIAQDTAQTDIFHSPSMDSILDSMLFEPCCKLPLEMDIANKKRSEGIRIFNILKEELNDLSANVEQGQFINNIKRLWLNFVQVSYFDYREIVAPLVSNFQWHQLKKCMAEANAAHALKEPTPFLLLPAKKKACSRCWKPGHSSRECNLCIYCGCDAHIATECMIRKKAKPVPRLVGSAGSSGEFFVATAPDSRHVAALVSVVSGKLTVDMLVEDLTARFSWVWSWIAKEQGNDEFIVRFPDEARILELSESTIQLPGSGALIRVSRRATDAVPKAKLHLVWVIVSGVPESKKHCEGLLEIGEIIGVVEDVDMQVLEDFNIVRIMVYVKDPENIPQSKEYGVPPYVYDITFSLESIVAAGWANDDDGDKGFEDKSGGQDHHNDANGQSADSMARTEFCHGDVQGVPDLPSTSKEPCGRGKWASDTAE
ncbi:unnamed protein product [Alopecurus aequalis]